ncbi:unnamed protein product [Pleuronectes platessa]|uniref:Uncharacterized protein n=1 Tax=Pleuronectes platessa TaxID=8262 RepID=A0A9N7YA39_PLEPL|nr:unnamed protein product [Pleuronectes platessa]
MKQVVTFIPLVQLRSFYCELRLGRRMPQEAAETVQASLSIMYGPPAYFCARTCSRTHTAITLFTELGGILATVACTASVHAPHLAPSCWSERVEKQGEWWRPAQGQTHTRGLLCSRRTVAKKGSRKFDRQPWSRDSRVASHALAMQMSRSRRAGAHVDQHHALLF